MDSAKTVIEVNRAMSKGEGYGRKEGDTRKDNQCLSKI